MRTVECSVLFIALLLALMAPSSASAAEVHVVDNCQKYGCDTRAVFTAAPGERNALTVEHETTQVVILRDTGAPLIAGEGCTALDANAARCVAANSDRISSDAALGDGHDRATSDGGTVDGGAGNDDLMTSGGALTGGPGEDVLRSDQRGAYFSDGDGRTPARDRYLGGPGRNTLSYYGRTDDVRVDLRRAGPGGAVGERDHIEGIEDATGGSGDGDEVDGGPGKDNIHVTSDAGSAGNVIRCGSGRDMVDETARFDRIAGDCERLALGGSLQIDVLPRATLASPRSALLTVRRCDCSRGRYAVLAGAHPIGSAAGTGRRLALRLNADGRRLLVQRGRLLVTIQYRERTGLGLDIDGYRMELRLRR